MTMDIKQSRMNVKVTPVTSDGQVQLSELQHHQQQHPMHHHHHHHHHAHQSQHLHHHLHQGTKLPEPGFRGATGRAGTTGKRSFDVAFLMLPDEKLAAGRNGKQPRRQQPPPSPSPTIDVESDSTQSEPRSEDLSLKSGFSPIRSPDHVAERHFNLDMLHSTIGRQRALLVDHHHQHQPQPLLATGQHATNDPMLPGGHERLAYLFPGARFYEHPFGSLVRGEFPPGELPRSAFSKVSSVSVPTESPLPPLSPDRHSCPSTSPPISLSPGSQTSAAGFRAYEYGPFLSPSPGSPAGSATLGAVGELPLANRKTSSPASKHPGLPTHVSIPLYHHPNDPSGPGTLPPGASPYFPGHPFGLSPFGVGPPGAGGHPPAGPPPGPPAGPHPHQGGPGEVDGMIRNPAAAAILSTLLPSAMSTFTLSAQNVCAKCNISFRMTSDLVYHMRSHHKSEHVHDYARRKREDKLKCPVCNESFRERHHLTRHMTAHQDKAGDLLEKTSSSSAAAANKRALDAARHHHHQQQQQQQHLHLSAGGVGAGGVGGAGGSGGGGGGGGGGRRA